MPTVAVNLDTTQYVQVNAVDVFNPLTLQSLRDSVRITLSTVKPAKTNTVFHVLGGDDAPLTFLSIDTNVWALAMTDSSSLIVTATDPVPVHIREPVDVVQEPLTPETDIVIHLGEISRKLSILIEYESMLHKVDLEENLEENL